MKISFDHDGTLTNEIIKQFALSLTTIHDVYILTSRMNDNLAEVFRTAKELNISTDNIITTDLHDKGEYIKAHNIKIDIHFDNYRGDVESINEKTDTIGVLIGLTGGMNKIINRQRTAGRCKR